MASISIEEIKKYNTELKLQQDRASKIKAEIEFNTNYLTKLCAELSSEIGTDVTIDNIEQIYTDRINKTVNTLESGKEILKRIAEGESNINSECVSNAAVNNYENTNIAIGGTATDTFKPISNNTQFNI